ncbi:Uncharacterised protein [Chlamydia trachomatis]|nr:Uncharacterised protein [Chlamydia trachomatis]
MIRTRLFQDTHLVDIAFAPTKSSPVLDVLRGKKETNHARTVTPAVHGNERPLRDERSTSHQPLFTSEGRTTPLNLGEPIRGVTRRFIPLIRPRFNRQIAAKIRSRRNLGQISAKFIVRTGPVEATQLKLLFQLIFTRLDKHGDLSRRIRIRCSKHLTRNSFLPFNQRTTQANATE